MINITFYFSIQFLFQFTWFVSVKQLLKVFFFFFESANSCDIFSNIFHFGVNLIMNTINFGLVLISYCCFISFKCMICWLFIFSTVLLLFFLNFNIFSWFHIWMSLLYFSLLLYSPLWNLFSIRHTIHMWFSY